MQELQNPGEDRSNAGVYLPILMSISDITQQNSAAGTVSSYSIMVYCEC